MRHVMSCMSRAYLAHHELGSIIIVVIVVVVVVSVMFIVIVILLLLLYVMSHLLKLPGGVCTDIPSSSSAGKHRYRHY